MDAAGADLEERHTVMFRETWAQSRSGFEICVHTHVSELIRKCRANRGTIGRLCTVFPQAVPEMEASWNHCNRLRSRGPCVYCQDHMMMRAPLTCHVV